MNTWGPVNPIDPNHHDDNYTGTSGDHMDVEVVIWWGFFWAPYSLMVGGTPD